MINKSGTLDEYTDISFVYQRNNVPGKKVITLTESTMFRRGRAKFNEVFT